MSLTEYQRFVCKLLAAERLAKGERYVAGGAALNELLRSPRVSLDLDLFHDTREAVLSSWESDRQTLVQAGHAVVPLREFPTFVEAEASRGEGRVVLQWVQDSAFRFFPLVEHPDFGLSLHPFDLAVNKTLALVGRAEIRDWFDIIHCHGNLQPFAYLVWAACGKDPGLSPGFILEQAARSTHYSREDYDTLGFDGPAPGIRELAQTWRDMLSDAQAVCALLPEDHVGECVLAGTGDLYTGSSEELAKALADGALAFHRGAIRGAWPAIKPLESDE